MKKLNLKPEGDHIVRALGLDGQVKMTAIRSTNTVEEARLLHDLSPVATVALGRFMSGLQLISQDLKNDGDIISATLKASGPLKGMTAVANYNATVKGYVENPVVDNTFQRKNKFDIAAAIGNGSLTVSRKQAGTRPYAGTVELISGEIAEDFTYYLYKSEQIPTIMALGVLLNDEGVLHAGGFLVQALPGCSSESIDYLEERISGFPEITYLLEEGFTPAEILNLFIGEKIEYLDVKESSFECDCSKERMQDALMTLGATDLEDLSSDEDGIELVCEFCSKKYRFSQTEMQEMYQFRIGKN